MQGGFKQLKVNKVCVSFVELEILSLAFKSNCWIVGIVIKLDSIMLFFFLNCFVGLECTLIKCSKISC